jgi:hypothetical protein
MTHSLENILFEYIIAKSLIIIELCTYRKFKISSHRYSYRVKPVHVQTHLSGFTILLHLQMSDLISSLHKMILEGIKFQNIINPR